MYKNYAIGLLLLALAISIAFGYIQKVKGDTLKKEVVEMMTGTERREEELRLAQELMVTSHSQLAFALNEIDSLKRHCSLASK